MDATPTLGFWWRFLALLALELSLLVVVAFAFQCVTRSAMWRRAIWQAALLGALVLLVCELTGASRILRAAISSGRTNVPAAIVKKQPSFLVTITDSPTIPDTSVSANSSAGMRAAARPRETYSWWPGILWCAGFGVLLGRILLVRSVFLLFGHRRRRVHDLVLVARVHELAAPLRIRRNIRVREIAELRAPIAFGLFRPTIGLPQGFCDSFTPKQRDVMLIHELAHLASRDAAWYWLADLLAAGFWWHPLGWWMRARLHAATEAAADEACLLVEDGPIVLAESLVQLGGSLVPPARVGLLNIGGNGFRSSLGRRVERLMNLHGGKWRPASRLRSMVVKTIGPILFAALAIAVLLWIFPPETKALGSEWRDSVAARAIASVSQLVGDESASRAKSLLGDAKIFFQAGKLDLAEALLDEALKLDPTNKEALNYLDRVHEERSRKRMQVEKSPAIVEDKTSPPMLERVLPSDLSRKDAPAAKGQRLAGEGLADSIAESNARTNIVYSGKGRQAIYSKLERIRLDSVTYDGLPLSEVVKRLSDEAKKRDPERHGVNIIVSQNAGPAAVSPAPIDPATGLPVATGAAGTSGYLEWKDPGRPAAEPVDAATATIRIVPPLTNITLGQALDAIQKTADRPVKYSVQDYAIVFSPKAAEIPTLHTRTFKLDPNAFANAMEAATLYRDPLTPPFRDDDPLQQKTPLSQIIDRQQRMLRGVNRPDNSPLNTVDALRQFVLSAGVDLTPPKALFYGDRKGIMFVRATLEDLEAIERAVQALNLRPPVVMEASIPPPQVTIEVRIAEMPESARTALGLDWLVDTAAMSTMSMMSAITNQLSPSLVLSNSGGTNYAIVLTDPQFRVIVRALEQRPRVDVLTGPKVTTLSSRQTQIKVTAVKTVLMGVAGNPANENGVVDLLTTKEEMGPVIDVIPVVNADGYTISLTIFGTVREFLGYDATTETVKVIGDDGNVQTMPKPLPRFRVNHAMAFPVIWDGQTVAIELGRFEQRLRIAFLTVTIIDPAGNRVHNEEDGPFRMRGIPPQRKAPQRN